MEYFIGTLNWSELRQFDYAMHVVEIRIHNGLWYDTSQQINPCLMIEDLRTRKTFLIHKVESLGVNLTHQAG